MRQLNPDKLTLNIRKMPRTEYDERFLQGMLNRMSTSYHKYGAVADAYPDSLDALANVRDRIDAYRKDGNTEWLIDAACYCMIEFMRPSHPDAHFDPESKSPGRVKRDGSHTAKENLDL